MSILNTKKGLGSSLEQAYLDFLDSFMDYGRSDVHAEAYFDALDDVWKYKPVPRPASAEDLRRHLNQGPYLGRYFGSPGTSVIRLAALDLDDHKGELDWEVMRQTGIEVAQIAVSFGLFPYPVRSGRGKGIHIFFFWDTDQSARAVRELLGDLIAIAGYKDGTGGIAKSEIEIFPKQSHVANDGLGNLIALPFGRESVPLNRDFEIVDNPQNWVLSPPIPNSDVLETHASEDDNFDLATVAEALKFINADEYSPWIKSGLAIKASLPETGFPLWNAFSSTSQTKYEGEAATRKRWDQLKPRSGGLTIASIFYWAEKAGWKPVPKHSEPQFADFVDILKTEPTVQPFPIASLPSPFQEFITNRATAMQVQPDLIAVPMLTVAATMLGRDWEIRAQPGWFEPSIVWSVCVAESGSMKSAAAKEAVRFVQNLQSEFSNIYKEEMAAWNLAKKDKESDAGPKPLLESCYVGDSTVESLKLVLSDEHNKNPRGILYYSDELAGWFYGLDQYKGKGNDRQTYLSLYDGGFIRIDRKSDGAPLVIPRSGLSICGGLQPAVVPDIFRNGDDGLTPRFQAAWPGPYGDVKLQKTDLDSKALSDTAERLKSMRASRPRFGAGEDFAPDYSGDALQFDDDAQAVFDAWVVVSRNRRETGTFGSYVEKQRGLLARLAMILHGMRYGDGMSSKPVDLDTLERALALVKYFESHARKLFSAIDAHPARPSALKIANWIRQKKRPTFTARDIRQNGWREFSRKDDEQVILSALRYLEAYGWIRIEDKRSGTKGGRPTTVARVNPRAWEI